MSTHSSDSALTHVVVVGAGASTLVAGLIGEQRWAVTAVDVSAAALDQLRDRLGPDSVHVSYVVADVCELELAEVVDVWHDRATFHFLTDTADQRRYADRAATAVRHGGHLLLANFAPGGPEQCSGLPVARVSIDQLQALFGPHFQLLDSFEVDHVTPWGASQRFLHSTWRRRGGR